ncbi:MAG: GIY-YIG nuclease family protein [Desulfamplus sp.]|nr:GIY-YIG nuclease family protein [Desulfamplus sp.]
MKGWVYIMTNKAMPDIVNVSYTMKDPAFRPAEMSHSESPYPYVIEHKFLVEKPHEFEKILTGRLEKQKEGKNWFRCSIEDAVAEIKNVERVLEDRKLQKTLEAQRIRGTSAALSFMDYLGYFFGVAIIIFLGLGWFLDKYIEDTFLGVVILLLISMIASFFIFIIIPVLKRDKRKENIHSPEPIPANRYVKPQFVSNNMDADVNLTRQNEEDVQKQKDGQAHKEQNSDQESQEQKNDQVLGEQNSDQESQEQKNDQELQQQKGDEDSQKQKADETPQKDDVGQIVQKQSQKEDSINKKASPPGTPLSNFYSTTYLNCYLREDKQHGILALYTDSSGNFFAYHSDLEMRSISEKLFDQLKTRYGMKYESGKWI